MSLDPWARNGSFSIFFQYLNFFLILLLHFPFWWILHRIQCPPPTKNIKWIRSFSPSPPVSVRHNPTSESWERLCRLSPIHKNTLSRWSMGTENQLGSACHAWHLWGCVSPDGMPYSTIIHTKIQFGLTVAVVIQIFLPGLCILKTPSYAPQL